MNDFLEAIIHMENFPNIIQGLGLALLTILVPLAIAILSDVYQKRGSLENEYATLDINVILDVVFKIKCLLIYIILIFCPLLLWENLKNICRVFLAAISIIGIVFLIRTIIQVYRWIKGDMFDYRYKYLKKVKNATDLKIAWRSVWGVKSINIRYEIEFFKLFFAHIDLLYQEYDKNLHSILNFLNDFNEFIKYRPIILLLEPAISFNRILRYHFKSWQNKERPEYTGGYFRIYKVLDSTLVHIEKESMKTFGLEPFVTGFKKHVEKYQNEVVCIENKNPYISDIFKEFYRTFFKSIEENNLSNKQVFWHKCFPNNWKITKINLENDENKLFSRITFNCFLEWALKHFNNKDDEKNPIAGEIAYNLFPGTDVYRLLNLLITLVPIRNKKNVIKNIIENPLKIGFIDFHYSFSDDLDKKEMFEKRNEEQVQAEQKTYELISFMYPNHTSKERLQQYIEEIKNLSYLKDSKEEAKRFELLETFEKFLQYVTNKSTNQDTNNKMTT